MSISVLTLAVSSDTPEVIYAVSTNTPNPLNALANLLARQPELPPWVDGVQLRFTAVLHSSNSVLNDDE